MQGNELVCADDCRTRAFLDSLEAPLMPWEIEEEERLRQRRKDLMRGILPPSHGRTHEAHPGP